MKPLRFHPKVQTDINEAIEHYAAIAEGLADGFWAEWQEVFAAIEHAPESHHFDTSSGLRRINFKRFPYNVLFAIKTDRIRVQVLRHNSRRPEYGARRPRG